MRIFFEWRVILDILLIMVLIYSMYRALRATGAWKIALGLTFAVGVALVARVLSLDGIEWLFSIFSQIALVAVLIIFQPEIRRVLERSFSFHHARRGRMDDSVPEVLDQALFDLAEKHWGGLVVLAGEVPINQWVTEGVRLDAVPSVPLLMSIFDPYSPGHDGAAMIEGGRLSRFAVHLPLSVTNRLPNTFGTRHHAAMGLSEKTDSLVFAVSEERGVVTAFRDGERYKMKKRGEVADLIGKFNAYREPVAGGRRTKKYLFITLGEIVVSLSLSVLIWVTFVQPKTEIREMAYSVPIEYSPPAKHLTLSAKPAEAKLLLKGSVSDLRALDPSQLRVQVDLSSLAPGKHRIDLSKADLVVPKNLKLRDVQPDSFDLEVKEIKKVSLRSVPLQPQLIGSLPDGFILTSIETTPSSIVIEENDSDDIAYLATNPISLEGLQESVTVSSKVIVPEKLASQAEKWPDVTVQLAISAENKQ